MQQAQGDQRDGQGIQAHQYGHGHGDQLGQPLVGHHRAEHGQTDDHRAVGNACELAEEAAAGRDQAHAGGQAGQHDDDGQQPQACGAKGVLHKGREDLHAGGGVVCQIAAGGSQVDQRHIDQTQAGGGDQAGVDAVARMQLAVGHARGLDGVDDDDAEDQRGQGIHGLVTLQKALGKGCALCGIGIGAQAVAAGGRHEGGAAQHRQCDDQNRGDDLAHVVHELAREQRQQRHQNKVGDGEG